MTERKAVPKPKSERYHHGIDCIQDRFIDEDELAKVVAVESGFSEPDQFDYDVASKIIEYVRLCSLRGQIIAWHKTGANKKNIGIQTGASDQTINGVLRDAGLI